MVAASVVVCVACSSVVTFACAAGRGFRSTTATLFGACSRLHAGDLRRIGSQACVACPVYACPWQRLGRLGDTCWRGGEPEAASWQLSKNAR